ncbi:hypothetical protein QVD17_24108 [Tagetes erecta]|uniref:Uncharacterized protein n=1 Tax=Tagetes erecta TaxID=13708 RepID=A0AAD8KES6_TARER|nr:hypothetical protein QVD17_24108 [Tagetes erecta]
MGGESRWRKIKLALGLNTCLYVPKTTDNDELTHSSSSRSHAPTKTSSSTHRSSKCSTKSFSEHICAICLMGMKETNGRSIFKAECSHSFHFHCIVSNVKHGNRVCPICRANWKEIPVQKSGCVKSGTNSASWSDGNYTMQPLEWVGNGNVPLSFQSIEPPIFDDDEPINQKAEDILSGDSDTNGGIEMKTYPEVSEVARSACFDDFGILINLKAPITKGNPNTRASVDLVTMLDVSSSMSGTKIDLLKQAMGFLIHNLGPFDRLSVVVFSSSARRLFPLRHMTETGKQETLRIIDSLVANHGTSITSALRKGAKVMMERKFKNPVSSMILLSDGQDSTYLISLRNPGLGTGYATFLPFCIQDKKDEASLPIHTFGFGVDHDAHVMHYIAEHTGGTFSFIEAESMIQDAFAQCIGGLLSVVVQELRVEVECVHPVLRLRSIKTGSYKVGVDEVKRTGFIDVGDLYAEEERDFLVAIDIPVEETCHEMALVKFTVTHKDPIRKTMVTVSGKDVIILRPESLSGNQLVSMEVDRQRNRLSAASAIAKAQMAADRGHLTAAIWVLEDCQKNLMKSVSGRAGDRLCDGLVAELREMMNRMHSFRDYETTGRAYMLSGLSSHSLQRATARGDSTEITSMIRSYQTQTMSNLVTQSQTLWFSRSPSTSMVNFNSAAATPNKQQP